MEIVLVRHGQPEWVRDGLNVVDPPLTELGQRQAALMAEILSGEEFDELLVSPLVRARQTAEPLYATTGRTELIDPWLEEIRDPSWHGTPAEFAEQAYRELKERQIDARWDGLDGGEPTRDFTARIHAGATKFLAARGIERIDHELPFFRIDDPGRRIVLVAHAGTNSVFMCHLLGLQPTPWEWDRFVLGHASISRLEALPVRDGFTFSLTSLSNLEHIPIEFRVALTEPNYLPRMAEQLQMYIDGAWVEARSGERFDSFDPSTGAVLASLPRASADDVGLAVAAARRTFDDGTWGSAVAERDRARIMFRIAELVREHQQELAELEVRDCGKPIGDALFDIAEVAFMFEYYAGWATKISGDIPPVGPDAMSLIVKEPVGVCGLIVPWNYPMLMAAQKVAPALATGCTVVLKPAEQTPLTALKLAEIAEQAGLPAGVFNVVTGFGVEAGAPLLVHPGVDKISFTGSKAVGQHIQRTCADQLKRVTLELGGKSPNIVFADADLDRAVPGTSMGIFGNQGEVCSAGSRVFAHRSVYDDVLQGMSDFAAGMKLGSGLDPDTTMGPLVSAQQRDRVQAYIDAGPDDGATLAFAGQGPSDPTLAGGYFVPPTIFEATNSQRIAREEIFGPVAAVIPFSEIDEVIAMSNDTEYGLAAAIWTRDISLALRTARAVRAGVVWINDSQPAPSETMWGGYKQSGIGRELGPYALDAYLEAKQIYINLG